MQLHRLLASGCAQAWRTIEVPYNRPKAPPTNAPMTTVAIHQTLLFAGSRLSGHRTSSDYRGDPSLPRRQRSPTTILGVIVVPGDEAIRRIPNSPTTLALGMSGSTTPPSTPRANFNCGRLPKSSTSTVRRAPTSTCAKGFTPLADAREFHRAPPPKNVSVEGCVSAILFGAPSNVPTHSKMGVSRPATSVGMLLRASQSAHGECRNW